METAITFLFLKQTWFTVPFWTSALLTMDLPSWHSGGGVTAHVRVGGGDNGAPDAPACPVEGCSGAGEE